MLPLALIVSPAVAQTLLDPSLNVTTVVSGLAQPIGMTPLPRPTVTARNHTSEVVVTLPALSWSVFEFSPAQEAAHA